MPNFWGCRCCQESTDPNVYITHRLLLPNGDELWSKNIFSGSFYFTVIDPHAVFFYIYGSYDAVIKQYLCFDGSYVGEVTVAVGIAEIRFDQNDDLYLGFSISSNSGLYAAKVSKSLSVEWMNYIDFFTPVIGTHAYREVYANISRPRLDKSGSMLVYTVGYCNPYRADFHSFNIFLAVDMSSGAIQWRLSVPDESSFFYWYLDAAEFAYGNILNRCGFTKSGELLITSGTASVVYRWLGISYPDHDWAEGGAEKLVGATVRLDATAGKFVESCDLRLSIDDLCLDADIGVYVNHSAYTNGFYLSDAGSPSFSPWYNVPSASSPATISFVEVPGIVYVFGVVAYPQGDRVFAHTYHEFSCMNPNGDQDWLFYETGSPVAGTLANDRTTILAGAARKRGPL